MSWVSKQTWACPATTSHGSRRPSSSPTPWQRFHKVFPLFSTQYATPLIEVGYLLQKFSIPRVLGCNVLIWGTLLCCSAAAQNYGGLLALRILLGTTEAVVGMSIQEPKHYKSANRQPPPSQCTQVSGTPGANPPPASASGTAASASAR